MKRYFMILLVASLPLSAVAEPAVLLDTTANYSDLATTGRGPVGYFGVGQRAKLLRFRVDQAGTLEQVVLAVGVPAPPSPFVGDASVAVSLATISVAENTSSNELGEIIGSLTGVSAAPLSGSPAITGYESHEFTFGGSVSLAAGDYWLIVGTTGEIGPGNLDRTQVFWQYAGGSLPPSYGSGTWTLVEGPNGHGAQLNGINTYLDSTDSTYFYGQMLGTLDGGSSSASSPAVPVPVLPFGALWVLVGLMGIFGVRHLLNRA